MTKAFYTITREETLATQHSSPQGLTQADAAERLKRCGRNTLPESKAPGVVKVFVCQFASPLIYVLVAAAISSLAIREWADAGFIAAVLLINAIIGTVQEYSAQRAAAALRDLVTTQSHVIRDGDSFEIEAEELVPGDIVMLESGDCIPADMRLLSYHDLAVDESLLTGESLAVWKDADTLPPDNTPIGDRRNMVFTGSMVGRGRGLGVVVGTALETELGSIAAAVLSRPPTKAPLLIRMESFTHRVAILVGAAALVMAAIAMSRGMPLTEILLLAGALAATTGAGFNRTGGDGASQAGPACIYQTGNPGSVIISLEHPAVVNLKFQNRLFPALSGNSGMQILQRERSFLPIY